jgi:hypothetical protein
VNVKVYVPSEWGTDHLHVRYQHPMFASKQDHQSYAQSLGLRCIAIYTGMIMETSFCKWFGNKINYQSGNFLHTYRMIGFDTKNRTWNIVGTGERPVAMTSQRDLGPLTLRTILLAFSSPDSCPSQVRLYSDNRSIQAYKACFENESKEKLRTNFTSLQDAERDYESKRASLPPNLLGW